MCVQGAVHEENDGVAVKSFPFLVGLTGVLGWCPNAASSHSACASCEMKMAMDMFKDYCYYRCFSLTCEHCHGICTIVYTSECFQAKQAPNQPRLIISTHQGLLMRHCAVDAALERHPLCAKQRQRLMAGMVLNLMWSCIRYSAESLGLPGTTLWASCGAASLLTEEAVLWRVKTRDKQIRGV